jgi:predicted metalloprotease
MQWKGRRGSANVEDRRGMGGKTLIGGGIGGLVIVLIITLLGGNPGELLNNLSPADSQNSVPYTETEQEKELSEFVSVVLADTEEVWTDIFQKKGLVYEKPTLVLYSGSVQSACGVAGPAVGPFYCPGDQKLYIDLIFYQELQDKFRAPGDFAMA